MREVEVLENRVEDRWLRGNFIIIRYSVLMEGIANLDQRIRHHITEHPDQRAGFLGHCLGELKIPNSKGRDCKSRPAHTTSDYRTSRPAGMVA